MLVNQGISSQRYSSAWATMSLCSGANDFAVSWSFVAPVGSSAAARCVSIAANAHARTNRTKIGRIVIAPRSDVTVVHVANKLLALQLRFRDGYFIAGRNDVTRLPFGVGEGDLHGTRT